MPIILALDTSTEACSVSLADQILFDIAPQQHSKILLPMIASLLKMQTFTIQDCTAIAFGQGPGSFTGLRIAAAVAQGLSLAHHLPLIGISSLASLALAAKNTVPTAHYFLAALDARMGEVYYALYTFQQQRLTAVIADCVANPKIAADALNSYLQNQSWVGIGSGVALLADYIPNKTALAWLPEAYPSAREVAALALAAYERGETTTIETALPHYLRNDIVRLR